MPVTSPFGDLLNALPLPLGSNLSIYGVSATELATVGPQAASASSANLVVDDDMADCPTASFTTIQSAVNAAGAGDRIRVCAGTYTEQVIIPAGKNGLLLFGTPNLAATIKAPAAMVDEKAIVRVAGAQNVTIRHFTISGPGGTGCDSLRWGVRVDSGGSAVIESNHITLIRDTPFSGCQNGIGILIGRNAMNQTGAAEVSHNLIDQYQKGGVVVDGLADGSATSYANVHHNEIIGFGPTPVIAQNGIQVSRGAAADVDHNIVTGNSYALPGTNGTGLLIFAAGDDVVIGYNEVYLNDDGISLYDTDAALIEHNFSHDQIIWDGLFADADSAGNRFSYNRAEDNDEHDCHDDSIGVATAGTANFWTKNLGDTENRPGLCKATPKTL